MVINKYANQLRNVRKPIRLHDDIIANTFIDSKPVPPPWWKEYGELADYVISNGVDNWIDTWLPLSTFKDGVIIELDIEYLTITNTEKNAMGAVGGTNSSTRNVVEAGSIVNGKSSFYSYSSTGDWRVSDLDVVPNKRYNFRYEFRSGLQIFYADGVEIRRTTDTVNLTNSTIMTLFARNYNNVRSGYVHAKWYSLKMSKLDGIPIADYMPLYVSKKPILDQTGTEYPIGSYVLVDNVKEKATVLRGAPLTGERIRPWRKVSAVTFDSNKTYPTIKLGAWKDYNKISLTFSSDDISNKDLFFGWFDETGMFEWNNGLMGYDGDTFVVNSEITNDPYTVTPTLTPAEKGDGTDKTIVIEYTSTSGELVSFGANADEAYTKKKNVKSLVLENTDTGTNITLLPAILQEEYQDYPIGSVGFIDEATEKFYGSDNKDYNFTAIE